MNFKKIEVLQFMNLKKIKKLNISYIAIYYFYFLPNEIYFNSAKAK
jgi:hypothetical protein